MFCCCFCRTPLQHGTHVAGVLGGAGVGVAKSVNLVSVLSCCEHAPCHLQLRATAIKQAALSLRSVHKH